MGETPSGMTPEASPSQLRADIEGTREELSETVEAIQERLSPQRLADDAKQAVRDATVGRVTNMANTVTEKAADVGEQAQEQAREAVMYVRDNPMPAILVGAGVAWLLMRSRGQGGSGYSARSWRSDRYAPYRTTGQTAGGLNVRPVGSGTSSSSQSSRPSAYGVTYGGSRNRESTVQRWLRENPLTVGAVAIAAGAIVGLGLPRTEKEDEWLGETRDTLVERARETAETAVEQIAGADEGGQKAETANTETSSEGTMGAATRATTGSTPGTRTGAAGRTAGR